MPSPPEHLPEDLEEAAYAILEGDESAREAALRALFRANPTHEAALRRWLRSSGALAAEALSPDDDAARAAADPNRLPRRIGDYELREVLGRGGFGTVYLAEQLAPIRRTVAVKLLNPGMDSREILARFAGEREALNRMDHPGIARLIDAGTTPSGRPFFVMEHVDGAPMAAWCRKQHVPLRERLGLFLKVCDATQHAHQKQVLHRDLSSNNVLIAAADEAPQPKIIDFGVAKSLTDPLMQGGAMTLQGTMIGTPEFMSPEQAAGDVADVDTRADVYALGVQLYELLTDQLPIPSAALRAQGFSGIAKVIATHPPQRASDVAPRPWRAALRGDLDAVVAKAIAKERVERYPDVGSMAADLRRYLADEPIEVVEPTTWYRLRKFVRRNRRQSVAGAAAVAAVGVVLVLLAIALARANREAELRRRANLALQEKADAGFRLLANEDRIERARATEAELPPAWPAHADDYLAWQRDYDVRLLDEQRKVEERLAALQAQRLANDGELDDEVDRHLERALQRLAAQLAAFLGPAGPAAAVRERLLWSDKALDDDDAHDARWAAARGAIKASDGVRAHAGYAGLRLERLPGLVPLGCDPRTRLWEFLDLRTHAADYPLPPRDPETGALVTDAGTGVVFVLVPGDRVAVGARRNDPGMERNDDLAARDELNDAQTTLEPFLIARTEMTVAQFARLGADAAPDLDPLLPVTDVDWFAATRALRAWGMQLPTEAQWEYACRAGTTTPWCSGDDAEQVATFGWLDGPVALCGQLRPNAFGLFDVHGNVAEWCRDEKLPYPDFAARAGDGLRQRPRPASDAWRVVRGGSVRDGAAGCRATARASHNPAGGDGLLGLRPVRPINP